MLNSQSLTADPSTLTFAANEPLVGPLPRQSEIVAMMPSRQPGEAARTLDRTQGSGTGPSTTLRHRRTQSRHRAAAQRAHSNHLGRLSTLERGREDYVDTLGGAGDVVMQGEDEAWRQLDAVKAITSSLDVKRKTRSVR